MLLPNSKPQGQYLRGKARGPFAFHSFITGYFPRLLPKVNWQLYQIKPLPSLPLGFGGFVCFGFFGEGGGFQHKHFKNASHSEPIVPGVAL